MPLRVLIAGGGTGGHVFPALAIKQHIVLKRPDAEVVFVGTRRGMEYTLLPKHHEQLKTLWISGLSRTRPLANLALPLKLTVSAMQCLQLLKSFRPRVVVGTGGYVMGPVVWMAQRLGIPTVLQEQNSFPGLTTRQLASRANTICLGYETAARHLPKANCIVTGNPLRTSFRVVSRTEALARWKLDLSRKTLLVFGGSAGARAINHAMSDALPLLLKSCNVIWQTGRAWIPDTVKLTTYAEALSKGQLMVMPFIDDMTGAYAVSDLAICRAGAMTLAELAMTGLPAIIVPYPFATNDHQSANALSLAEKGAAVIVRDSDLSADALINAVHHALDESVHTKMAEAMRSLACPDAGENIADIIIKLAEPR